MLEPFNAAVNNPSTAGRIEVKNVEPEAQKEEAPKLEAPAKKAPPAKKEALAKKPAPAPKKKVKLVVLGMEHPDVVNSDEYDYEELKAWAAEATPEEVKEFLADTFPQALEPVEVPDDEPVAEEPKAKPAPKRKAPAKKEVEPNVVDTSGEDVSEEYAAEATKLAEGLDNFDD